MSMRPTIPDKVPVLFTKRGEICPSSHTLPSWLLHQIWHSVLPNHLGPTKRPIRTFYVTLKIISVLKKIFKMEDWSKTNANSRTFRWRLLDYWRVIH